MRTRLQEIPRHMRPVFEACAADGWQWVWDKHGYRVKMRHPEVAGLLTVAPGSAERRAAENIRHAIARSRRLGRASP